MGGKSAQTIGYRYRHLLFEIWAQHVDTLHRFVAGGKRAWAGRVESNQTIQIYAPAIWGDDEDNGEGGMVGPMDVQFGLSDQPVNARMTTILGERQTGNRGWFSTVFEGIFGSYVPNPKTRAVLLERVHAGWPGGEAWYPETAAIPLQETDSSTTIDPDVILDPMDSSLDGSAGGFDFYVPPGSTILISLGTSATAWSFTPSDDYQPENYSYLTWWNHFGVANLDEPGVGGGTFWNDRYETAAEAFAAHDGEEVEIPATAGGNFRLFLRDATVDDNRGTGAFKVAYRAPVAINAMNPAHIIRYTLTQKKGIPDAMLSEESFTYAADVLFAEGFGLCEEFDPDQETPEAFILRICDIIGACCTQSKTDGLIYLDLLRNDYDKDALPVLTDDDIVDWQDEQAVPAELTNSVQIGWRDVLVDGGLERITPPVKALGHIRTHGREMNQVIDMRGIPFENIAMRVAKRELDARSKPLVRLSPTTHRRHTSLRPGQPLLINCPKRGRVDMVVRVGEVDHGTPTDARLRWVLLQDVFDLPATVEIDPTTIHDSEDPLVDGAGEVAIEAPYIELVATLPAAQMEAVGEESGYLLTGVTAPTRGTNYAIYSKLPSEAFERREFADFCPTAVTFGDALPLDTDVQLTSGSLLNRVEVGSWGLWEDEIFRVDGIDDDLILTMGRACADTVPAAHAAGTRIFFLGDWNGSDQREYAVGDELDVKLPVRRGSEEQALADKDTLEVTFAQRQFRPYPPGNLMLNGEPFYASGAITPAPPGGGGGGGSGGGGPTTPPPTGTNGGPASQELGPNGGYPDDGPPLYPLPTVFDVNVIDDPGMDDPATLARWRKRDGSPLGPEWSLTDGKLRFQGGAGTHDAYDYGARFSKPYMPFPRLSIASAADVQNSPGVTTSIGVAWGSWQVSHLPSYLEVSEPASYPAESTATHTWLHEIRTAGVGFGFPGEYVVMNFVPVVRHVVVPGVATATVDNFEMTITEIDPAVVAESPANLDLSSGLTGITLWPDPSDTNPYVPDISVSGGVATADFHSELGLFRWMIWDDPLVNADEADKFVRLRFKGLSNDSTTQQGSAGTFYTVGGVTAGLAFKSPDGETITVSAAGRLERGDFTPRECYHLVPIDASAGYTVHAAMLLSGSVGTQAKFKDLEVASTVDAYPESP
ncbi:MAG TPA: hypothetical protein VLC71_05860 [Thermomonas sp.]|nr:hypothetical protein [Thermomonas sp.]